MEIVTLFAYLGSIIDNTVGTEAEITARTRKAQVSFGALNKIWHSTTYTTQTKFRIFNKKVKAVLLYGCETWKKKLIIIIIINIKDWTLWSVPSPELQLLAPPLRRSSLWSVVV